MQARTLGRVTDRDADAQTAGDLPEVHGDLLRPHAVHVRRQKDAVLQTARRKARASVHHQSFTIASHYEAILGYFPPVLAGRPGGHEACCQSWASSSLQRSHQSFRRQIFRQQSAWSASRSSSARKSAHCWG